MGAGPGAHLLKTGRKRGGFSVNGLPPSSYNCNSPTSLMLPKVFPCHFINLNSASFLFHHFIWSGTLHVKWMRMVVLTRWSFGKSQNMFSLTHDFFLQVTKRGTNCWWALALSCNPCLPASVIAQIKAVEQFLKTSLESDQGRSVDGSCGKNKKSVKNLNLCHLLFEPLLWEPEFWEDEPRCHSDINTSTSLILRLLLLRLQLLRLQLLLATTTASQDGSSGWPSKWKALPSRVPAASGLGSMSVYCHSHPHPHQRRRQRQRLRQRQRQQL